MTRTAAAVVILSLTLSGVPAFAAEENGDSPAVASVASQTPWSLAPLKAVATERPAALPMLYVSFATLQAFDVYSTRQALARGAREVNPLMQGVVGNPSAFYALKATTTLGAIVAAERLWPTNKAAAIAVMVITNGVAATVAARNVSVLKRQR